MTMSRRWLTLMYGFLFLTLGTAWAPPPLHGADNFFGVGEDAAVEITPKMEERIKRGLEYLARRQNDDGSWSSQYGKNVGEVSLALMAFMAMGNLPGEGQYGSTVTKGVNWVMTQMQPSGLIQYTGQSQQAPVMYGHALATLMLSEVWGQMRRPDVGQVLRRAVDLIIRVQGQRGGWNYEAVARDGDNSVGVMQIIALQSAQDAGIYVPQETISQAIRLVKSRFDANNKGYGYADNKFNPGHSGASAAGATIMLITGDRSEQFAYAPVQHHIDMLAGKAPAPGLGWKPYFWYYTGASAYIAGEKYFQQCIAALDLVTTKEQRRDGSWGSIWETGFSILAQAMPYRYLPIYQR
jgi:hypothetical protein